MKHRKIALILSLVLGCTTIFPNLTYGDTANGWAKSNGTWYFYENGNMKIGWVKDGGSWYYLKSDGSMAQGWQKVNGTWYYLNASGAMKTGWLKDGGTWYYLNDDGSMATGWKNVKGTWYYLNSDGSMKTGWLKDGAYWYYLNNDGSMAHDTVIDNYTLDSNGQWIEDTKVPEKNNQDSVSKDDNAKKTYTFREALNKFSVDSSSVVLSKQDKNTNNLYSPMSVFMALCLLSEGAENDTKDEILKALNASGIENLSVECKKFIDKKNFENETGKCKIADSVWLDNKSDDIKFKEDVLKDIAGKYNADIFTENLTSDDTAKKISDWISKNTYGVVGGNPEEFKNDDAGMLMEIFNTMYFKDTWLDKFMPEATEKDKFNLSDGTQVESDFMSKIALDYLYSKENEYKITSLKFCNRGKMVFILPAEGKSPYDILNNNQDLNEALSTAGNIDNSGKLYRINYKIPKFKYTCSMNLNKSMLDLGFNKMYSAEDADFSNFTDSTNLFVSKVKQDAGITVDENGAEAAAFTEIDMLDGAFEVDPYEKQDFVLDRPFLFAIMDGSDSPMFIGVVNNPTLK